MNINATLFLQAIVFAILVWFTMRYVWPPLAKALDERAENIRSGLSAADEAKAKLATVQKQVTELLSTARDDAAKRLADAERRGQALVDEAKARASTEAAKIVANAQAEATQESNRARDALRAQVAELAVKGAEQILKREVNAGVHAELLQRLQTEL